MDEPHARAPRAPWLSIVLAAVSATAWTVLYAELLRGPVANAVLLLAGPLGLLGIIVGIIHAVRRARPRWLAIVGIVLSVGSTVYIAIQVLHILATLAFA